MILKLKYIDEDYYECFRCKNLNDVRTTAGAYYICKNCEFNMAMRPNGRDQKRIIIEDCGFNFKNYRLYWLTRENCCTVFFHKDINNRYIDLPWLPFDTTEDQLKVYLTFL